MFENPGGRGTSSNVVGIIVPLMEIGLTDLSKYGGTMAPPAPPAPTVFMCPKGIFYCAD